MSTIVIPFKISRKYIQAHPDYIFLYGHDELRRGCLGQAWDFYNEANTFFIPTLYKYCANPVYYQDLGAHFESVDFAFSLIPADGRAIIPCRKIGRGCARMNELSPKLLEYIENRLKRITTPHEINYLSQWQ